MLKMRNILINHIKSLGYQFILVMAEKDKEEENKFLRDFLKEEWISGKIWTQ